MTARRKLPGRHEAKIDTLFLIGKITLVLVTTALAVIFAAIAVGVVLHWGGW